MITSHFEKNIAISILCSSQYQLKCHSKTESITHREREMLQAK